MRESVALKILMVFLILCSFPAIYIKGDAAKPLSLDKLYSFPLDDIEILDTYLLEDHQSLLMMDMQGNLSQWNAITGESHILLNLGHVVTTMFSPSGRYLACACGFGNPINELQIIDIEKLQIIYSLADAGPNSLDFSQDEQYLAYASGMTRATSQAVVMHIPSLEVVLRVKDERWISDITFLDYSSTAIVYGGDASIAIWDFVQQEELNDFIQWTKVPHGAISTHVEALVAHPSAGGFYSLNAEGTVFEWNLESQDSVLHKLFSPDEQPVTFNSPQMMFDDTGRFLFIRDAHNLRAWDMQTDTVQVISENVVFFRLSPNHLITVDENNVLSIFYIKRVL